MKFLTKAKGHLQNLKVRRFLQSVDGRKDENLTRKTCSENPEKARCEGERGTSKTLVRFLFCL